jgi:hypothetical protein
MPMKRPKATGEPAARKNFEAAASQSDIDFKKLFF